MGDDRTTQEDLDAMSASLSEHLRKSYPDVGFILLAVTEPVLLEDADGVQTVDQAFVMRSNAQTAAAAMALVAKGLNFIADQESQNVIVTPGGIPH